MPLKSFRILHMGRTSRAAALVLSALVAAYALRQLLEAARTTTRRPRRLSLSESLEALVESAAAVVEGDTASTGVPRWTTRTLESRAPNGPCAALRALWAAPPPHPVSQHPLVIVAGEGTTGTHVAGLISAVLTSLQRAPSDVLHWHDWYSNGTKTEEDPRAIALHDALFDLEPTQRDSFDFRLYDGVGGVADTPIPQYFPYIYRQYPRAKVILTERDPTAWVTSRQKHHPNAFLPFAVLSHALSDIRSDRRAVRRGYKGKRVHAPDPNNMMGSSTAFVLHNTMVRARARPQRCASMFADARLTSSFSPPAQMITRRNKTGTLSCSAECLAYRQPILDVSG
jgi:hypothetical protein